LIMIANILDGDIAIEYLLLNEMVVNFNMLSSSMINGIRSKCKSSNIITL